MTGTSGVVVAVIGGTMLLASATPVEARRVTLGTITVDPPTQYGQSATFAWQLDKKPLRPALGVFCSQDGAFHYIAEQAVVRATTGTASVIVDNAYSNAMPGSLDETRPASCQAFVWDELGNGQQPVSLTSAAVFMVQP